MQSYLDRIGPVVVDPEDNQGHPHPCLGCFRFVHSCDLGIRLADPIRPRSPRHRHRFDRGCRADSEPLALPPDIVGRALHRRSARQLRHLPPGMARMSQQADFRRALYRRNSGYARTVVVCITMKDSRKNG